MTFKLLLHRLVMTNLILLFIFQSNWIYAQCGELFLKQDSLIKNLRVETREAYLSEIQDGKISSHSNLAYFMSFNKLGNITIFHSNDTTGTYPVETYKYLWDNRLSEINITFKNKPERDYIVKNEYNLKKRKIGERQIREDKVVFKTDFDYDKNGRLKKKSLNYVKVPATRAKKQKYFYDEDNQLIRRTATGFKYIANEMVYDRNGNRIYTYRVDRKGNKIPYIEKEYNAQNQLTKATNYGPYLLLCGNEKKSTKEDVMIVTYTYYENGLLATETVLRNEDLIYFWEYEYVFF